MQNIKMFGNSLLEIQSDRAVQREQEALCKISEAEFHTKILHEEQRSQILSQAQFKLRLQEKRADHADYSIQNLGIQLRSEGSTNLCDMNKIYYEQNCKVEREREREYIKNPAFAPHRKCFLERNSGRASSL